MRKLASIILVSLLAVVSLTAQGAGEYAGAQSLGKADSRVMGCPPGSFWDPINGGECWSCGNNQRAVHPVNGPKACVVKPKTLFSSATLQESNKTTCPSSAFFDLGTGGCWTCPSGTKRTVFSVTSDRACERIIARKKGKAKFYEKTKSIAHSCKNGSFANVGSRNCYKCASGWKHDRTKKINKNGVCFKPRKVVRQAATRAKTVSLTCSSGFFDPIDGGSCWTCPGGYERQPTASVKDGKACVRVTAPGLTSATFVKSHSPDALDVARGVTQLGCAAHGKRAFFDRSGGGSCWTCPASHPVRSLFAVHGAKACMSTQCGQEGGRPCLVWERLPSCDKGLVEDFVHNQCRQPKNLACKPFVKTVASLKKALDEANAAGEELTEKVLNAFPAQKALMESLARKGQQLQDEATRAAQAIPLDDVMEPMTEFLAENQDKVELMANMAGHAQRMRQELENVLLDPELICAGNTERLVGKLDSLGFASLAKPSKRALINLGATTPVSGYPFAAAAGPVLPQLAVNDGLLKHHRIVFDIGVSLPAEKLLGSFENFKMPFTLGIQVATNFTGETGVYFMHGLGAGASAKSRLIKTDMLSKFLGMSALAVGFQYNGPHPTTCKSTEYSWGVPVKLTDWVGIGVRPGCSAHWSGLTLTIPLPTRGIDIGELAKKTLYVSSAPSGSIPISGPSSTTQLKYKVNWPEVKSFAAGYEGAARISGEGAAGIF